MYRIATSLLVILTSFLTFAQPKINGKFEVLGLNGNKYGVKLQIQSESGGNALGSSTIIVSFDKSSITLPAIPQPDTDFIFTDFSASNYESAFISRPADNQLRINLELNAGNGTIVKSGDEWNDLVIIYFDVVNAAGTAGLKWDTSNIDWAVYGSDNSTRWLKGNFTNSADEPLPVELTSFTANVKDKSVLLKWETATEINNSGFDIERNTGGEWKKIGFVEGAGSSQSEKIYNYEDKNVVGTKIKYRLKQIDNNGSFKYSDEAEAELIIKNYELLPNYPNPFNPSTTISYVLPEESKVEISIYNSIGELVDKIANDTKAAGSYQQVWNAGNYASGIYILNLQAAPVSGAKSFSFTRKMMLIK